MIVGYKYYETCTMSIIDDRSNNEGAFMGNTKVNYLALAWQDLRSSPGWFGKMALLTLIAFIPFFGPLVLLGYTYGWARDVSWGVRAPLPPRIFGTTENRPFSLGAFLLIFTIVLWIISFVGNQFIEALHLFAFSGLGLIGAVVEFLLKLAFSVVITTWFLIGGMRIAIYDRISPGFQINKIVAMLRRDTYGILSPVLIVFLISVIVGIIIGAIIMFLVVIFAVSSIATFATSPFHDADQAMGLFMGAIGGVAGIIVLLYLVMLFMCITNVILARAAGLWCYQFDAPQWRGQDDPMPFEFAQKSNPPTSDSSGVQAGQSTYDVTKNTNDIPPHPPANVTPDTRPHASDSVPVFVQSGGAPTTAPGDIARESQVVPNTPAQVPADSEIPVTVPLDKQTDVQATTPVESQTAPDNALDESQVSASGDVTTDTPHSNSNQNS